jgi:hypothetical protein
MVARSFDMRLPLAAAGLLIALSAWPAEGTETIETESIHLRSGPTREWSSFPEQAPAVREWKLGRLGSKRAYTLTIRQQDVKQSWRVLLNGKPLGELLLDERDAIAVFPVEPGDLSGDANVLRIEPKGKHASADDIRVGSIELHELDLKSWLSQQTTEIEVVDADSGQPLPCCLTIVDQHGSLVPLGTKSNDHLAVRTGVVYTSSGKASVSLFGGEFTVFATRGFEYSLAQGTIPEGTGQNSAALSLKLRREVPVPGYVACDTHIHTLTHSGHGDATIDERMITLAGEGIELPIATDHNVHIDYEADAQRMGVRQHFTPVPGNEVTTKVGHFNVFPVAAGARVPNVNLGDWKSIFGEIFATPGVKACILNHARDLHSGVRPFGPALFNDAGGERLDGVPLRFNAMEVINSGATQTDPLELFRDWMALLNRGYKITPVGSSDSHDVSRFIVGQGRTYIRCDDHDPSQIDVSAAVDNFLAGRVLVSYGLVSELTIDGKYSSGDFAAPTGNEISAEITVSAPHWINPTKIQLYANGQLIREEQIPSIDKGGVKWRGTWNVPRPTHDVFLTAIAIGNGIDAPYWPTAKPYQPTSADLDMHTLACSGAVWIDGDGDGRRSCARDYAERLWSASDKQIDKLLKDLADYDAATAAHAFFLYQSSGGDLESSELKAAMDRSPGHVRKGFGQYYAAWRKCQLARAGK